MIRGDLLPRACLDDLDTRGGTRIDSPPLVPGPAPRSASATPGPRAAASEPAPPGADAPPPADDEAVATFIAAQPRHRLWAGVAIAATTLGGGIAAATLGMADLIRSYAIGAQAYRGA
jgi:hypothetical protein